METNERELTVLYEDNHVIVVLKPQNVPCCPDETGDTDLLTMVKDYIKVKYNKPGEAFVGLVHRLDRPTGGVMVFAKTSKAAARLAEELKQGEMEKRYYAVVVGKPRESSRLQLTHYLLKNSEKNIVKTVPMAIAGAKIAVLDYTTVEEKNGLTLLDIRLHTGRAHQIRVQMSAIGNSIFGDQKYGAGKSPEGFNLALWAVELRFIHPTTREKMTFRIFPPTEEVPWKYFDISRHLAISIKNVY